MKKSEVLQEELDWFTEAYKNSASKGYSEEYRRGFKSAIGWLRLHQDMAWAEENRLADVVKANLRAYVNEAYDPDLKIIKEE